jgi:predicted RNA-binding Zn-ribbon protein involved in translation (DUF1610 family)
VRIQEDHMAADRTKTYLWCTSCRRSFSHDDAPQDACPVCGSRLQTVGKWSAIVRGLMSQELAAPEVKTKHRQILRMIWTRNGMGEQYYRVLEPGIPYNRFEAQVTDLLCRGADEGWARFIMPPSPSNDENAYRLELVDEERFIHELEALFKSGRASR